ncbi:PGF-CTERM-anchored ABC transporter substrate-binding protein [Natronobeatus ordinarius]|uniref:PGF-CTERM-anchored ABC transporter substrate-binding protein n=1 Tax=Natronobeatus ordinarius TaxID=2963433 RepID=UPI0020CDAE60|nr:PGF-CTERM-anchored ABC transporter substrate-binding protein [Natronobeatus ordinarius]
MRTLQIVLIATLVAVSAFSPATVAAGTTQAVECEYPLTVTDATGEEIVLEEPPESVVALQASDAQTVFEIGAEDRLVGLPHTDATSGLDRENYADVSDGWAINHEQVIALEPDVVLAANITADEDVETLREAGLTVYHFDAADSIEDVRETVLLTGELTGECDGAQETADWMDDQLEIVETALEDVDRPLAYYAMTGDDGWTAGSGTFIHEALETAGVENVAEGAGIDGYQQISPETVVDEDPEWIIYPDGNDEPPVAEAVQATTAYQEGNFVTVDDNQINQPAPQIVAVVVEIVEAVHPEAYQQASDELEATDPGDDASDDESQEERDDSSDEESGDASDDEDGIESDDDSVPGFGVPVAIASLLVAGCVLLRGR